MSPVLGLLLLVTVSAATRVSFRDHKILHVPVLNREQASVIGELEKNGVDVWSMVIGREAHLRVSPLELKYVKETLNNAGMFAKVAVQDLQVLIDEEQESINNAAMVHGRADWVGTNYVSYNEIVQWILSLPSTYANLCKVERIGESNENRDIYVIKIGRKINEPGVRKIIFTESNIHAREWLSHASVAYAIKSLLTRYNIDSRINVAINKFEWHFVLVSNPDGYELSRLYNRMWRKTTSNRPADVIADKCFGADPNRNFNNHFGGDGTSNDPCSDIYRGRGAFSENETAVLRDYTTSIRDQMVVFQSVHSYAQLLMLPYAYQYNAYPHDFQELMRVIRDMADEIYKTSYKHYSAGNVADFLNPAAGSTMDWIRDELKTKYVLAWELRPTSGSTSGFLAPASEIEPTGIEVLAGFLKLSETVRV